MRDHQLLTNAVAHAQGLQAVAMNETAEGRYAVACLLAGSSMIVAALAAEVDRLLGVVEDLKKEATPEEK